MRNPAGEVPTPFLVPERLQSVDSTNRYLADLVSAALSHGSEIPEGYAVVAEFQTAGRGRLGRRWEAPAGSSVLCSILLKPDLGPELAHLVAWAVALAASQSCSETSGVQVSLKWPNDLIASTGAVTEATAAGGAKVERKVAGMLSEVLPSRSAESSEPSPGRRPGGIVVGIGINANWPDDWPPADSDDPELSSIAARATSLNRLAGRMIDRDDLISRLLRNTREWNAMLAGDEGRRELASAYRLRSATIGREARVELADETFTGLVLDIDDAGCLLVSTGACIRTVAAGDVIHLG